METFEEDFEKEYNIIVAEIQAEQRRRVNRLKEKYRKKLPYKEGDIIYNVTGIIKIEEVILDVGHNGRGELMPLRIEFIGPRFKWVKGGFIAPTKSARP